MKKQALLLLFAIALAAAAARSQQVERAPLPQEDRMFWKTPHRAASVIAPDVMFFAAQGPAPAVAPAPPMPPGHGPDLGKWWKNSDVVRELQLSDAQVNQLEQAFLEHRLKLIDLRADVERQEARLQPLIEADQIDEAKVSTQIDAVLAARARLEKQHTMMMLGVRRVLSVEQWKKLQAIQHERERMWRTPPPPGKP
jgi:Spy/CpxP family protein refolding chaperone